MAEPRLHSSVRGRQAIVMSEQLLPQRTGLIDRLVSPLLLQDGNDTSDEILVAFGHDRARQVEAVDLALAYPGAKLGRNHRSVAHNDRIAATHGQLGYGIARKDGAWPTFSAVPSRQE